ncbi:MAG: threonylcarbamoyl-AMP synthase [Oscillospiraceae bacterium]|jgi:L-threonylcarbamoyladenylate synthase|nr:threonylcarbamoyl-AMP synthase [Oscillospiraceae bacterium]
MNPKNEGGAAATTLRLTAARPEDVAHAAALLRAGELVAMPTETVYGLAANALDPHAVASIFTAKRRPPDNPLIVHIAAPEDIAPLVAAYPPAAQKLAAAFWPGPLTVILPKSALVPDLVSAGLPTVALRIPAHPAARALLRAAGVPLAAPSANRSGSPSPTTAAHVLADLDGRLSAILDGGECSVGVESTVVTLAEGPPCLLRPGGIPPEALRAVLGELAVSPAVTHALQAGETAQSPGMKYKHYAPQAELTLLTGSREAFVTYLKAHACAEDGVLCFDEDFDGLWRRFSYGSVDDPAAQAQQLFARLRELDAQGLTRVFCHTPRQEGVGLAVYNRLLRAAGFRELAVDEAAPAPQKT